MKRPRIITNRVLNRTVLARQLLLERRRLSVTEAVERVGGLQTQYAPTAYIGLWSRLADFNREALTRSLRRRSVVQDTLMRATIHTVSSDDYSMMVDAIRRPRQDWWLRVARSRGLDLDYEKMTAEVRRLLAEGPLWRSELVAALGEAGWPKEAFEGVGLWVDLVRVPPSGTWERRRADLYHTAERWLGYRPGEHGHPIDQLIDRFLRAFGPAAPADIASWAGAPVGHLAPSLERMELRRFRGEDGAELVDLPRLRLVDEGAHSPVRFLGPWETILLAPFRRSGILPEEYRSLVFSSRNPQSVGTVLADGRVVAAWRPADHTPTVEPFAPFPRKWSRAVDEELEALRVFMA